MTERTLHELVTEWHVRLRASGASAVHVAKHYSRALSRSRKTLAPLADSLGAEWQRHSREECD